MTCEAYLEQVSHEGFLMAICLVVVSLSSLLVARYFYQTEGEWEPGSVIFTVMALFTLFFSLVGVCQWQAPASGSDIAVFYCADVYENAPPDVVEALMHDKMLEED